MDFKCKECGNAFETQKSLHCHLKAHSLGVGEYYVKFFDRKDLLTGESLAFNNCDQYFNCDFNSLENYCKWLDSVKKEEAEDYLCLKTKERFRKKKITISPPNLYYDLSRMPNINVFKKNFGSYSNFLKKIEVHPWFNKKIPENFWEQDCSKIKIFIDTREKMPIVFDNNLYQKLDFGDYTVGGKLYSKTFIDRKSQDDFRQTFGKDINRFKREMDRCVNFNSYMFVLIESSIEKIEQDNKTSKFKSNLDFVWHNVRDLMIQYPENIQFVFAHSRSGVKKLIPKILYFGKDLWNCDLQYYIDQKINQNTGGSLGVHYTEG